MSLIGRTIQGQSTDGPIKGIVLDKYVSSHETGYRTVRTFYMVLTESNNIYHIECNKVTEVLEDTRKNVTP